MKSKVEDSVIVIKKSIILVIISFILVKIGLTQRTEILLYSGMYLLPVGIGLYIGRIEGIVLGILIMLWQMLGIFLPGATTPLTITKSLIYVLRYPLFGVLCPTIFWILREKIKCKEGYKEIFLIYVALFSSLIILWFLVHILGLWKGVFTVKVESYLTYTLSLLLVSGILLVYGYSLNRNKLVD